MSRIMFGWFSYLAYVCAMMTGPVDASPNSSQGHRLAVSSGHSGAHIKRAVLYVLDPTTNVIRILDAMSGAFIGVVTPPSGVTVGYIAVGNGGDLYAESSPPRFGGSTVIYQYHPGEATPFFAYTSPAGGNNFSVSGGGEIALSCTGGCGAGGDDAIAFFEPGNPNATRLVYGRGVRLSTLLTAYGPGGTLWIPTHPHAYEVFAYIPPGGNEMIPVRLDTSSLADYYGLFTVDSHGDIWIEYFNVTFPYQGSTVHVFGGRSGRQFSTVSISANDIVDLLVSEDGRYLYVIGDSGKTILVYSLPQGGNPIASIPADPFAYQIVLGRI